MSEVTSTNNLDWSSGVVAILRQGKPVGAGFIAARAGHEPVLLTCAHVLTDAGWSYGAWDQPIRIRCQGGAGSAARLTAQVEAAWFRDAAQADVAGLRLTGRLPADVTPLPLAPAAGREGVDSHYYGFPAGYPGGLRGEGRVLGLIPHQGEQRLQIRSEQVTAGFSGGPVWLPARQRVIGLVLAGKKEADAHGRLPYTAFAAPTEALTSIVPDLLAAAETAATDTAMAPVKGLPADLRLALRRVFLTCAEFENMGLLRALFNRSDLQPLRAGLPHAPSSRARANLLLDYLSDTYLSGGANGLVLFSHALADEYEDVRRDRLLALAGQVRALKENRRPQGER